MFSPDDTMQRYNDKARSFSWAKSCCKTLSLLLVLFSYPATAGVGAVIKTSALLPKIDDAPSVYHTLTTQCPYPGTSNVALIMASTNGSLEHAAINNLKNCLDPPSLKWTAEI
jgi:hypothetical protein